MSFESVSSDQVSFGFFWQHCNPHHSKLPSSILNLDFCLCGVSYVLHMSAWVPSRFSSFLLPLTGGLVSINWPLTLTSVCVCVYVVCPVVSSRVYSHLTCSVFGIGSGSTAILSRIK